MDPPRPRADPTASVIRRSAEWRSGAGGLGLSQDERDFLTELAAKRELVTDRARFAEYATAASTGQRPMPVARPATAPAQERGTARPATAPRRGPARLPSKRAKTPPRRETNSLRTAFADPRDAHGHALEQADEVARGSAIKPKPKPIEPKVPNEKNASPVSRRDALGSPGRDATISTTTTTTKTTTTTTTRRRALFAPFSSPQYSGDDEKKNVKPASTSMIDVRARDGAGAGAGAGAGPKSADEATASWRDSLRGARLRRAAARGGAEEPAAFFITADAGGNDASRRAVEDARPEPEPEPAREENAKTKKTMPFLSRLESPKKSPKSPEVSLEHLSAVRLTADERAFLARLAKERALVTDRARHGAAAAAAAAGVDPRESPLRASLPDPIVAQPSPLVSPPAPPSPRGAGAAKTRSAKGASPVRFARATFGDDVAVAAARMKHSPARRYGGDSAAAGAVVAARWRPSPTRESLYGASRERPSTAAARMSSEHARDMWRREPPPGEEDEEDDVSHDAAKASDVSFTPDPKKNTGEGVETTPRSLAALEALVARASRSFEAPLFHSSNASENATPERVPSSVSPARASFERARPPARASWGPGDKSAFKRVAYRPDVYSRGLGVSISGVLGEARVSRAAFGSAGSSETSRSDADPEWEWQGSWQREWQTSLESPDEERRRSRSVMLVSENARDESSAPFFSPFFSETPPAVSESTPKSLAEMIRARADAADAEDSPAWTLSPSPERAEGEGEYSAYSPREKSAAKRELVPPRGSPLRSPVSRSPLSMERRAAVLAAEPFPRLGAGSYRERRDARKASRRGDEPFDAGGTARTGLDVRGDTSGAAVFY